MKEIRVIRRNGDIHIIQIDNEDYDRVVAAGVWRICPGGRTFYAHTWVKDDRHTGRKLKQLHRLLLGDACIGKHVDHIDGNGLNNQRSNLRICTRAENLRNKQMYCNNTSGFKGVSWKSQSQRWMASIRLDGRKRHLGYFDTAEEAYAAYCEAAIRFHGEFARLK